ncbi:hypothetical protein F5Y19DRAFT_470041 [Xylariaceae sp. FL1651]|nr:hypothetical protein F5Y19DRAFT_470041 [Xylariaceae sp. FL1651]
MSQHETTSIRRIGFTQLSRDDSPQSGLPTVINIIFVHGLRGHPQTTWECSRTETKVTSDKTRNNRNVFKTLFRPKHAKASSTHADENSSKTTPDSATDYKVFWPRDYLLEDVPEAQVWTYGYNADVIGGLFQANNQNSISQHGRDLAVKLEREIENEMPIVFVAHSLGGIIVKDAIRRSSICGSRTKLVVFLGTPHRGSHYGGWGVVASNLASLAFQDSNKQVIRALEVNSEVLDNIHEEFLQAIQDKFQIHSFQEARALSGVKGLHGKVVEDYSSKVGLPPSSETVESVDANHMEMARCRSKSDPQYHAVVGVLKQFIRRSTSSGDDSRDQRLVPAAEVTSGVGIETYENCSEACHYIPLPKNTRFTGRTSVLGELQRRLFIRRECQTLALVGLGGVGKTQVVLELAYWVKNTQPGCSVFWVPALSDKSFEQAYTEIARRLGIRVGKHSEDIKESVRRYLESDTAGRWLLIVDNADDMETLFGSPEQPGGIDEHLPRNESGSILFTTRSKKVAVAVAVSDVVVLHEMSQGEATEFFEKTLIDQRLLRDQSETRELLRELTYLPLAISQAAAYLNQNSISIREYLSLLNGTQQDLVSLLSREFHDNTRYRGSDNAVATTWLVSFDQIRRDSATAAELLSFMSCIESKVIPLSMLPRPQTREEMQHAIGVLCGYAFLVRRGDQDIYDMHRLVQIAIRVWIRKHDAVDETESSAIQHLASIFPWDNIENRSLWREYLPHALYALESCKKYEDTAKFDLYYRVGTCLISDRRFKEALQALKEAYRWREQWLYEEDHFRLTSEHALASAYLNNRQIKEAIEIFEHVVAVQKKTLVEEDHSRLASEHELARAYLDNRQIKEAIEIFEHVVAVRKKTLAEEDHSRLTSEHALASAYLNNRQIKEAIGIFEHVVAVQKKTLVEEDHSRLASEHELARAYLDNRQIKEAIEIFEHVVAVRKKTLAEEDHSRLTSEHALASAYLNNRQIKEAIEIFEHVVAVRKKTLAEEDHSRLASEHALASAYLDNRQIKEAIEIFEHVIAVQKKTLAEEDDFRLTSEHALASAYLNNRQIKEAIEIFEHVIAVRKKTLAEEDHSRLTSEHELARAYLNDGRIKEAIILLEHVTAVEITLDMSNTDRAVSQDLLQRAYAMQ